MPNFNLLCLCLSYTVLSIATLSSLVHAKEEVAQCPPHGCPFLPRDISFDKLSRTALKRLRSGGASTETIDERKRLLQDLSTAGNDDSTVWTLIGYKGGAMKDQINQDRALILSPFQMFGSEDSTNQHDVAQLLGVFDGHGKLGETVAQYTVTEIPIRLSNELRDIVSSHVDGGTERDEKITKALIKVFNDIDQSIPTKGIGGCTASVVLRIGSKLYVANAGDSVSFVALYTESTDEVNVVYVTREDKPHLPDEYQRITRMGGRVSQPDGKGGSSRVVFVDPNTGYVAGLAMSRSIGDWPATGVISEPIVQVLSIPELLERATVNPKTTSTTATTCAEDAVGTCQDTMKGEVHVFAVSATDGLMDYLKPNEIARAFADSFYKRGKQTPHPHTVAEDLILKASEGWYEDMGGRYRDDITVAAARIYSSTSDNSYGNAPETEAMSRDASFQ